MSVLEFALSLIQTLCATIVALIGISAYDRKNRLP